MCKRKLVHIFVTYAVVEHYAEPSPSNAEFRAFHIVMKSTTEDICCAVLSHSAPLGSHLLIGHCTARVCFGKILAFRARLFQSIDMHEIESKMRMPNS